MWAYESSFVSLLKVTSQEEFVRLPTNLDSGWFDTFVTAFGPETEEQIK